MKDGDFISVTVAGVIRLEGRYVHIRLADGTKITLTQNEILACQRSCAL